MHTLLLLPLPLVVSFPPPLPNRQSGEEEGEDNLQSILCGKIQREGAGGGASAAIGIAQVSAGLCRARPAIRYAPSVWSRDGLCCPGPLIRYVALQYRTGGPIVIDFILG